MALDRRKLENFIKRQLLVGRENDPIIRLTLRHAMGGQKAATVLDLEVNPDQSYIDLASQIETAANDDAEGLGGLQGYVLASYYQSMPDKIRERFSCRIAVESNDEDTLTATEAPTQSGLTAQLMRHNEANARVMAMSVGEVIRQQNRMIERMGDVNDKLMERHFDVLELYEKMLLAESTRDMEKMKVTSDIARTDQLVEKGLLLAPVIVNKFMGKKMLPEKATAPELMVQAFVESLRPDQMHAILEKLDPPQQLLVLELIAKQQEREAADKAEKEAGEKK